jgi:hypothetical protein
LLVSVTIPSGTTADFHDGARWVSLGTPLTLTAGIEYVLAATVVADGDHVNGTDPAHVTIDPAFSLAGEGYVFANGVNLQYPDNPAGQWAYAFGANLEVVPEPSMFALLSLGLAAGALRLRAPNSPISIAPPWK